MPEYGEKGMVIGEKILISKNFTLGMGIWRYH